MSHGAMYWLQQAGLTRPAGRAGRAGGARCASRPFLAVAASLAAAGALVLAGCGQTASIQPILTAHCETLGGARQQITVHVRPPASGLLHVEVREQGISALASFGSGKAGRAAATPIDRLGTIDLAAGVLVGQSVSIHVASVDSSDITAEVCLSAELIRPARGARASAERRLAQASEATGAHEWQAAFDDYRDAARLLDDLGLPGAAAAARHAMAELAYGFIRRGRDSIALVSAALAASAAGSAAGTAHDSSAARAVTGARLVLLAKALMNLPAAGPSRGAAPVGNARVRLTEATRLLRSTPLGRRELPRLESVEGVLEYRAGHLAGARRLFEKAAADCRALGDWECFAQARQNLAALAEEQQDYPAALAAYEEALRSLDPARMPMLSADISYNLARLAGRIGLFGRSAQAQRTAMRLYAGLGQCDHVRRSAASLGEMLVHVGSIGDARTYLDRAATFSCSRLLAASGTQDAASLGSEDTAAPCAETPASGATLNGDIAIFEALLSMSEIARLDGHFPAAATCLASARRYSVDARTQIRLVNASAALASELGHPRRAAAEFRRALELSRTAALTEATQFAGVSELGLAAAELGTGADAEATRHAAAALRLSSRRADMAQIIASLRTLGAAYAAAGQRALAIRTLRAAIGLIEQFPTGELDAARRATYLATQHGVFAELMDLLAVGATERGSEASWSAFAVAEQGHARSLRYALEQAARERAARDQGAHEQAVRGEAARERAGSPETGPPATREPASSTTRYGSLLRTLAAAARQGSGGPRAGTGEPPPAPLLRRIIELAAPAAGAAPPVDRAALAATLRSTNAVLVEYAAGRDAMFAFVTDGATMHVTRLASRTSIARAAARLANRLRAPEEVPDEIRAAAKQLAALVLWPIRSELTRPRVIFVPAGALHTIPFAVLPWSAATSSSLVLQHLEISTVPSALLLTRRAAPPPHTSGGERFVLLGDPVLRDTIWYRTCSGLAAREQVPQAIQAAFAWSRSLPMLPGSRAEVLGIARIARRWRPSAGIETLLGCEATAAALRRAAPAATVLHIATHGLVDAHRPRLSALALTPDPPSAGDAEFRLLDIMGLPLHARIVVLSACDTSRGRLLPGEGVLGLAQAFLQAGSGSVVASYWRVSDAATVPFMKTFYRYLLRDRLPVGEALRRTQLDLARSGSYSWAAFSLYGEPDSRA